MITLSMRSSRLLIAPILSETLAPPMIVATGRVGLTMTRSKYSISFFMQ